MAFFTAVLDGTIGSCPEGDDAAIPAVFSGVSGAFSVDSACGCNGVSSSGTDVEAETDELFSNDATAVDFDGADLGIIELARTFRFLWSMGFVVSLFSATSSSENCIEFDVESTPSSGRTSSWTAG